MQSGNPIVHKVMHILNAGFRFPPKKHKKKAAPAAAGTAVRTYFPFYRPFCAAESERRTSKAGVGVALPSISKSGLTKFIVPFS